ncbi:hypothetical protein B5X24_HaOG211770 [Helicoverpa armigera]|uniref:Uncharacterized protein n=1 Tax=Helicoverpa armigera TaxID=29058 RepID=A0A2W1BHA0_HELAM|nr:hypothetical protein B5X24_HaOG211770 [Helicoverpa armigera]
METTATFVKVLSDIEFHSKATKKDHNDMVKVIRYGLRATIFDHYSRLHQNARTELTNKIEMFWKPLKKATEITTQINDDRYTKLFTIKPETVTAEKEKTLNNTEKKELTTKIPDRIDIKDSDFKNRIIMRGSKDNRGNKDKKASNIHIPLNEELNKPSIKSKDIHEEGANYEKSDETSNDFSSAHSGRSFESNSIEISQELQKEYNTRSYMTLYPEAITYQSTTEKKSSSKMVHRADVSKGQTEMKKMQTLWIEESTGKIPKHVLDKLTEKNKLEHKTTSKVTHESKNKKSFDNYVKKKTIDKSESNSGKNVNKKRYDKSESEFEKKGTEKHFKHMDINKNSKKNVVKTTKKVIKHIKPRFFGKKKINDDSEPKHQEKHVEPEKLYSKEFQNKKDGFKINDLELRLLKNNMGPLTVEYNPDMTKPTKRDLTRASKTTRITRPPIPVRNRFKKTKESTKPSLPPRLKNTRDYEPLQKATIFTKKASLFKRKPNESWKEALRQKAKREGHAPGQKYKNTKIPTKAVSNGGLTTKKYMKKKEKSLRKNNDVEKDPTLLKRISELEKELIDVKNKLTTVAIGTTVNVTSSAVTVTQIDEKAKDDLLIKQVVFEPYEPVVKKDNVKLTGTADKKLLETNSKTVKDEDPIIIQDFSIDYQNDRSIEDFPHENMTDISTTMDLNAKINMKPDQTNTDALRYGKAAEHFGPNNEFLPWTDSFKFDKIEASKSTTTGVTKPKNVTNSTTVKPTTSLATPAKSTVLNATRFDIGVDKDVSISVGVNKIVPTTIYEAKLLPNTKNVSSDIETTTISTKNVKILSNTPVFGRTIYKTLKPKSTPYTEETTPFLFYRKDGDLKDILL